MDFLCREIGSRSGSPIQLDQLPDTSEAGVCEGGHAPAQISRTFHPKVESQPEIRADEPVPRAMVVRKPNIHASRSYPGCL